VWKLLKIRNLSVNYGRYNVLDGLNLDISEGETLAIIGESGAGKTTLGLSIMRLIEGKVSGDIVLQGKELLKLSEQEMQSVRWNTVSMAFQNTNNVLNPVYNILDQVAEPIIEHGLANKNEARKNAAELLERFGISEKRFSSYPHQLSGGEQQRVLIAMSLSNNPAFVIMDEPLSSLDVTTRLEICNILQQVDCNRTRLVITHDLDTASRLAHKIAVLYGGRIIEIGLTDDVLKHPKHPYTRALIRAYPNMTTTKDLQGIKGRMTRPVPGCPFHPRCSQSIDVCRDKEPQLLWDGSRAVACHRGGIVTLLSVANLSKSFGSLKAVDSVNLDIASGETVALVGQSGSGKSTLAWMIMGLHSPSGGSISIEGKEISNRDRDFYKRVQMIFQKPGESLSHRLTVLESVMEPLGIHGLADNKEQMRERAIRTIGEVELPQDEDFLNTYPHHLSGGELQRVAIARALVLSPDLLIADEPTAFLDASVGAKVLKLLLNLQEHRGLSILYITHDIAAARKVSDRIAVMLNGRIIEEASSNELVTSPKQEYTKKLLFSASSLKRD
jgi:peptide/nickel transport system ATP-binding protein